MVDVFSAKKRSDIMGRIRSKNTMPEVQLRRELHRRGYRYRLHDKHLPGKPDIVMPKYSVVIQVRGCFWHGHSCIDGHVPKSREEYWGPKLARNISRDKKNDRLLRTMGWSVIVVWGCKTANKQLLDREVSRIERVLWKNSG